MFNIFRAADKRESGKLKVYDFSNALKAALRREMTQDQMATTFACMDRIGESFISFSDVEAYTAAVEVQSDIEVSKACEKLKKALSGAASEGFAIDVKMSDLRPLPSSNSSRNPKPSSSDRPKRFRVGDRVWYARLQTEGIVASIDNLGKSITSSSKGPDPRICRLKIIGGAAAVRNVFEDFDDDWLGRLTKEQFGKALSALGVKRGFDDSTIKRIFDRFGNLVGRIDVVYAKVIAFAFPRFIDSERHAVANIITKFQDAVRHKEFGEAALRGVFRRFDKNKTGYVTPLELRRGIESMGIEFSDYDVRRLLERLDPEGDYGKVNYMDFAALVREASVREQKGFGRLGRSSARGMVSKKDLAAALQRRLRDMVIESCTLEATCNCSAGDKSGGAHDCEYALWRYRPFAPSSNPNSVAVPGGYNARRKPVRRVGHANGVTCDVPWKEGSLELLAFAIFRSLVAAKKCFLAQVPRLQSADSSKCAHLTLVAPSRRTTR